MLQELKLIDRKNPEYEIFSQNKAKIALKKYER